MKRNSRSVLLYMLAGISVLMLSLIGCGGDDEEELTPMDELEGRYTLDAFGVEVDGVTITVSVSEAEDTGGELALGSGGTNASMTLIIEGDADSVLGASWQATATTFTLDGDPVPYTWDGTYLEFNFTDDSDGSVVTLKWRKVS